MTAPQLPREPHAPHRTRGVVELAVAAVLFALMAWTAKRASARIDGAQVAFVRHAIGLLFVLVLVRARGAPMRFVRKDLIFLRGFFGGFAVLGYFLAIAHLPVGTATLLNYTAPVFTVTFSAFFLGERLSLLNVGALVTATAGVTLVIWGQGQALGGAYGWVAVGLASALLSGAAVTAIRAARRTDGTWEVFFGFCLIGLVCTAPFALATWVGPSGAEWSLLAAVGLLAVGAQFLMTHALGAVEAATGGVLAQFTVVMALGLGHFLEGDPVTPMSLSGAVLTLTGVSVAAWLAGRPSRLP